MFRAALFYVLMCMLLVILVPSAWLAACCAIVGESLVDWFEGAAK